MDAWFAALMGTVQGLTEFLPISSTAHLRITPALLGEPDVGAAFSAVIQLGTLLAVIVYFWRDLTAMTVAFFKDPRSREARMPWLLVAGTIPIVVIGLTAKDWITGPLRSLWVVAGALIGFGLIMALVDRRARCTRDMDGVTFRVAALIGLAQSLALIPGVSRSGATIVCALALGMKRPAAARFSFLLGIPAIGGSGLYELPDALAQTGDWTAIAIGTVAAAISGYAAIAWLLRYLSRKNLALFAAYRVILGVVVITLTAVGVLIP